jgi:hypothetical protein
MLIGLTLVGSEVRFDWLPNVFPALERGADPDLQAVDWTSLRDDLAQRRLLGPPPPHPASTLTVTTAQQANRISTPRRIPASTSADPPADSTSLPEQLSCQAMLLHQIKALP